MPLLVGKVLEMESAVAALSAKLEECTQQAKADAMAAEVALHEARAQVTPQTHAKVTAFHPSVRDPRDHPRRCRRGD